MAAADTAGQQDVPGRSAGKWAKAAEWERHRGKITELYRDRGLRLEEVVEIMTREHNFSANPRMYKTRIKKWGIDKKHKAHEVAALLSLKAAREAQGKASEFIVRGRKVDWARVEAYLKRDPALVRKLAPAVAIPATTTAARTRNTPSSTSDAGSNGSSDGAGTTTMCLAFGRSGRIICRTPPPDPAAALSIPVAPLVSMANRLPEEIARLTRDYYTGAISAGIWVPVTSSPPSSSSSSFPSPSSPAGWASRRGSAGAAALAAWGDRMRRARHAISLGGYGAGFAALGRCLDEMRGLIRDEDPGLLFHLMGNTLGLTPKGKDLGAALCAHIAALTRIVLGARHPIAMIFDRLHSLVKTIAHFVSVPVPMKTLMDMFESRNGGVDEASQSFYAGFVALLRRPEEEESKPEDRRVNMQQIIDFVEGSRNFCINLRFHFAYLTYLSETVVCKETASPPRRGPETKQEEPEPPPAKKSIVRFREAKSAYMFNAEVMGGVKKEEDGSQDIMWEVDCHPNEHGETCDAPNELAKFTMSTTEELAERIKASPP